jgi:hypothetical protein
MAEPTSKLMALFPIVKARATKTVNVGSLPALVKARKTQTVDVGNLVDAAGETVVISTVTGAALGDYVLVSHSLDVQDITVTAYVQATDTVEVRFQNEGAATVNLASGTVTVTVLDSTAAAGGYRHTESITCKGAALGDFVLVSHSLDAQDIVVTAYVQAADTVEVVFNNISGTAAVDLASGTVTVLVLDKNSGVSSPF